MSDKANTNTTNVSARGLVPFTGGLIIAIYAWFWPKGYGHWLGSIVRAFRATSGI